MTARVICQRVHSSRSSSFASRFSAQLLSYSIRAVRWIEKEPDFSSKKM